MMRSVLLLLYIACAKAPERPELEPELGVDAKYGLLWTGHLLEWRPMSEYAGSKHLEIEPIEDRASTRFFAVERQHAAAGGLVAAALVEGSAPDAGAVDALVAADREIRAVAVDAVVESFEVLGPSGNATFAPSARGQALARGMVDLVVRGHAGARMPDVGAAVEGVGGELAAVAVADLERTTRLDAAVFRYYQRVAAIDGTQVGAALALREAVAELEPALVADLRERIGLAARVVAATPRDERVALLATTGFRKWIDAQAGEDAFPAAFGIEPVVGPGLEGPGGGWGPGAEGAPPGGAP